MVGPRRPHGAAPLPLLGGLEGGARDHHREPHTIVRSAGDRLGVLARVKTVRRLSP